MPSKPKRVLLWPHQRKHLDEVLVCGDADNIIAGLHLIANDIYYGTSALEALSWNHCNRIKPILVAGSGLEESEHAMLRELSERDKLTLIDDTNHETVRDTMRRVVEAMTERRARHGKRYK